MIRTSILSLLVLLFCGTAHAQIIRGTILDPTRRPVVGAAVILLNVDSVYLDGTTTDTLGGFRFVSTVRPYRLLVQHLAFEPIALDGDGDDVGEIILREATNTIGAIVVEAERPLVKVEQGRLTYDLEALAKNKAVNNAYEALTKLPGVSEREGKLELAGMGGVTVILNGKPTTMSAEQLSALLKSTPVERIEKAEVMYSTPPQYHVRGAAINLVMRRGYDRSFAGEVHGEFSNRYYNNWEAGGNFVFSSPKWSADATYSAGQYKSIQPIELFSRHTLDGTTYDITQHQQIVSSATKHNLRAAIDYGAEGKGRLSAAYTGSFTPRNPGTTDATGTFVSSHNDRTGDDQMHNASLRYTSTFGLDLSADYTHYRTSTGMTMQNRYADGRTTLFDVAAGQTIDRLSLNADQEHTLEKGWQLSYGAAFDWAKDLDQQHYNVREGEVATEDTNSQLTEYTGSLYAGFAKQLSKGSLSLSLTGEYYRLGRYENWSLYPQATFVWMFSDRHLLQLSLSSDKRYPSYWEMQEAVSYIDGYSEIRGTPGLRPSRSYNGQALYMFRQKYMFVLFWKEMPDYFIQTGWQASDRLALVYQSLNWNTNRQVGANVIVPFRIGKWLDSRVIFTGLYMKQRCDAFHDIAFDRSKWVGIAQMENTVRLSHKPDIALDISGHYQSPAIQGTFDTDPSWSITVGAKWTFDKGRASLTARCADIFESANPAVKIRYAGQHIDMDSGLYTRTVTLHFSYRFGSYKEKKRTQVDTSRFGH
ncbi:MAG: outer membrane beta-barrel family protein [Alistipes sp.]